MNGVLSPRRVPVVRRVPVALFLLAVVCAVLVAPATALAAPATSLLTIDTDVKTVAYNVEAEFTGTLTDELLNPVDDYTVQFQRSIDGATWKTVENVPSTLESYSHQYVAWYAMTRAAWFRLSFAGDDTWAPSLSQKVLVKPRVILTTPAAPKSVRAGNTFTAYGYLRPRHASGAVYVKIRCYRKSASGAWVLKRVVGARDVNYGSYTKYRARVSLPKTGRWKLIARYAGTAKFATTQSGARYLRVK